ncbi:hypothetical protein [Alphaentomopoxvirus acuprea]|uniref:Uncharacterized protein n=1 Tax=Alphaentomopoxvirus acuprea TaxID=62099 RepID=W6JIS1_9POXV|nr:hypothetical protein BA82_gp098 [Anomala cuprea entomopoxvirus]BAO49458.1 hypothetical protein [Anomala cuprea entomopoxvirus]
MEGTNNILEDITNDIKLIIFNWNSNGSYIDQYASEYLAECIFDNSKYLKNADFSKQRNHIISNISKIISINSDSMLTNEFNDTYREEFSNVNAQLEKLKNNIANARTFEHMHKNINQYNSIIYKLEKYVNRHSITVNTTNIDFENEDFDLTYPSKYIQLEIIFGPFPKLFEDIIKFINNKYPYFWFYILEEEEINKMENILNHIHENFKKKVCNICFENCMDKL